MPACGLAAKASLSPKELPAEPCTAELVLLAAQEASAGLALNALVPRPVGVLDEAPGLLNGALLPAGGAGDASAVPGKPTSPRELVAEPELSGEGKSTWVGGPDRLGRRVLPAAADFCRLLVMTVPVPTAECRHAVAGAGRVLVQAQRRTVTQLPWTHKQRLMAQMAAEVAQKTRHADPKQRLQSAEQTIFHLVFAGSRPEQSCSAAGLQQPTAGLCPARTAWLPSCTAACLRCKATVQTPAPGMQNFHSGASSRTG